MQIRYTIGIQISQEPTTGFAPASTYLQDRRLSVSGHVGIRVSLSFPAFQGLAF